MRFVGTTRRSIRESGEDSKRAPLKYKSTSITATLTGKEVQYE